jgi:hypothetical protein
MSKIIYKLVRKSVEPCKSCSSCPGPGRLFVLELTEIEPINKEILLRCRKGYQDCNNCKHSDVLVDQDPCRSCKFGQGEQNNYELA